VRTRLAAIAQEQAALLQVDRARQPLTAPIALITSGFGVTAALVLDTLAWHPPVGEQAPTLSVLARIAVASLLFGGMVTGVGGLAFLFYRLRHRPSRARVLELDDEGRKLRRELKALHRLVRGPSLTPDLLP
jgi:hypothetical protein